MSVDIPLYMYVMTPNSISGDVFHTIVMARSFPLPSPSSSLFFSPSPSPSQVWHRLGQLDDTHPQRPAGDWSTTASATHQQLQLPVARQHEEDDETHSSSRTHRSLSLHSPHTQVRGSYLLHYNHAHYDSILLLILQSLEVKIQLVQL